jgi:hypothetical protein
VTPQPLSEEEFDSLSEALERLGERAMNLEQLDGFLASLVCGPEEVSQTECLREVLGFDVMNHPEAASAPTAPTLLALLSRHRDSIAHLSGRRSPAETLSSPPSLLVNRRSDQTDGQLIHRPHKTQHVALRVWCSVGGGENESGVYGGGYAARVAAVSVCQLERRGGAPKVQGESARQPRETSTRASLPGPDEHFVAHAARLGIIETQV